MNHRKTFTIASHGKFLSSLSKPLVLAVMLLGASQTVPAAEFVMKNGTTLEGEIVRSSNNTSTIKQTNGVHLMVGHQDIMSISMAVDEIGKVEGNLDDWRDGIYKIQDDDRLLHIQNGELLVVEDLESEDVQQAAVRADEAEEPVRPAERLSTLSPSGGDVKVYGLVTGEPEEDSYSAAVGISALVKIMLLPEEGIDLKIVSANKSSSKLNLLNENWAELALFSRFPEGAPLDDLRSIAPLWQRDDETIELVARQDVDEDSVYAITKVIFDNLPFLSRINPNFLNTSLDGSLDKLSLPIHPGAQRYFEEVRLLPAATNVQEVNENR